MTETVDFVPFATGSSANVTSQADYIAESTTGTGFISGVASSADCNKAWRQGTFQAAVLATMVSNTLSINVLDDGNLSNAVTNLTDALESISSTEATGIVSSALGSLTLPFSKITGTLLSAQFPTMTSNPSGGPFDVVVATDSNSLGYVSGATTTASGAFTASGYYIGSDMALKENVIRLDEDTSLAFVCSLEGFTHNYIKDPDVRRVGLSAQAIRAGRPEAISAKDDGTLIREIGGLDPDLVMSIRALTRRVAQLEAIVAGKAGEPCYLEAQ